MQISRRRIFSQNNVRTLSIRWIVAATAIFAKSFCMFVDYSHLADGIEWQSMHTR